MGAFENFIKSLVYSDAGSTADEVWQDFLQLYSANAIPGMGVQFSGGLALCDPYTLDDDRVLPYPPGGYGYRIVDRDSEGAYMLGGIEAPQGPSSLFIYNACGRDIQLRHRWGGADDEDQFVLPGESNYKLVDASMAIVIRDLAANRWIILGPKH